MEFRSETTIKHPREAVFLAYRDRMSDVVAHLADIKAVNVLAREEADGVVKLHNEWVGQAEIPAMAKSMISPDQLRWDDYATWTAATTSCSYEIKTRAFRDAVRCTGSNTIVDDPVGARVILAGSIEISLKALPGVPSFLAKRMVPQVEKFIVGLIAPSLEKTAEAVAAYLDAEA